MSLWVGVLHFLTGTCPDCAPTVCDVGTDFRFNWNKVIEYRESRNKPMRDVCGYGAKKRPRPYAERACNLHRQLQSYIDRLGRYACENVTFGK